MDETLIHYTSVEVHQQGLCVLGDANLQLHRGKFVYLVDKVDSGKTSLLKTFYGKLDMASGKAEVLGYRMTSIRRKRIPQLQHRLGVIFRDFQLLTSHITNDNLEFILRTTGWENKREIRERIVEVLNLIRMENKGYKLPNELSGGEQQRIMVTRAVFSSPEIILADESTGDLDVETGKVIVELLHNTCWVGSLIMMATYNFQLVAEYPGQVYRCAEHRTVNVTDEFTKRESN